MFSLYIHSEYQRNIEEDLQYQLDKMFCLQNYTFMTNSVFHALFNETNIRKSIQAVMV